MAATDKYASYDPGVDGPVRSAAAVTPNDGTDLSFVTRFLFVGGAGNLTVTMADGVDCTFTGVAASTTLKVQAKRVKSTGTTATNIVAMW